MKYNFDEKIDRTKNHSAKWEEIKNKFISNDLWPMWIADMDFKTAPEINDAILEKANQGIYGYVYRPDSYYKAASDWIKKRFNYKISPKTLINSPGVVPSISILIRQMTKPGDKILIQTPVYYPFFSTIQENGRIFIENPLKKDDNGYYSIDFQDFEEKIKVHKIKLFLFCSPHNPVGRVWTKSELMKIEKICLKYQVRVIADEIWRDLVFPGHIHTPLASLSKEMEKNTITCFSPTKTFNLAGLQSSFVTFPNIEELKAFDKELGILDIKRNNPFSLVAFEAAYTLGESWLEELIIYLENNINYTIEYINKYLPKIKIFKPEGTYLLWLDFSNYNMSSTELSKFIQSKAKLALDDGFWFGKSGENFQRINIACPKSMLKIGLNKLKAAFENL